jgi:histidine triad (HIT) family protein
MKGISMADAACVFCAIVRGEIPAQVVLKSDGMLVIKDIAPKAPTHYLVIPEKHVSDITAMTDDDMQMSTAIFKVVQELARHLSGSKAFRLIINNGTDAGQSVFHLHVHFLSGKVMTDL